MKKILLGSLAFAGLYSILFYPTVLGIGIGLLFFFLHCYLFLVRNKESKNTSFALVLSVTSVIFATLVGWSANGVVQGLDILFAVFLSFCAGYFYKKETAFSFTVFSFIFSPLSAFIESLFSTNTFFSSHKLKKPAEQNKDIYNAIFRGVVIAFPILLILFVLLTGADPIFKTLTGKISFSLSQQFIISAILFVICFVWGITSIKDRLDHQYKKFFPVSGEKLVVESLIVTISAAALFAVFLLIQLRYLFLQVPETELHQLGINVQTYSEYVRQGFFQLLIAAMISTGIIAFILQYLHTVITKYKTYVTFGLLVLTVETELLLLSSGKRLYLYEQAHGLTESRFFGIVFLLWLSFLLILLFIAVVKKLERKHFFIALFTITTCAFAAINIVPIDSLIATKYPPTINHEIDYEYISRLSPEAAIAWPYVITKEEKSWKTIASKKQLTDDDQGKLTELRWFLENLNLTINYLQGKYGKSSKNTLFSEETMASQRTWQAFNMNEYKAYLIIQKNPKLFAQVAKIIKEIDKKQNITSGQQ